MDLRNGPPTGYRVSRAWNRNPTGENDETAPQLCQSRPRPVRSDGCPGHLSRRLRLGRAAAPPGSAARLADQRLRLLPRHALERSARPGRNRTAPLFARRLARDAVLFGEGARGARLDRSGDPRRQRARAGRGPRRGARAAERKGAFEPDPRDRHDQRLEPPVDRGPADPRRLPAGRPGGRLKMNARQIAALLFLSAVWGASFLFIRIAAPVLGPFPLMAGRVILAAGALWLYAAARRSPIVFAPYGKRLLVLGLIHSAIPFSLIAAAEIHLTASMAAVLLAAQPLFAALIGSFWLGEPISARRLTGLGLGIVGVAVLMGWSPLSLDATSVASVVAVLAASIS